MARIAGPSPEQVDDATRRLLARMLAGLRMVASAVARRVGRDGAVSVDDLATVRLQWADVVDGRLLPLVAEAYQGATLSTALSVAAALPPATRQSWTVPLVSDDAAEAYLATRTNHLAGVGDDLWETMRGELLDGLRAGEAIPALQRRVRQAADLTGARAEAVARTEIVGAGNAGTLQQTRAAGMPGTKQWLATRDARTRESHRRASGQTVPLDGTFTVGGWPMDRPHDDTAPAGEVVQCRCGLVVDLDVTTPPELTGLARRPQPLPAAPSPEATITPRPSVPPSQVRTRTLLAGGGTMPTVPAGATIAAGEAPMADQPTGTLVDRAGRWRGPMCVEGEPTKEGTPSREFDEGALYWEEEALPLTLTYQPPTHGGLGGDGIDCGRIDRIWRDGPIIYGEGIIDPDAAVADGRPILGMVRDGIVRGISIVHDDTGDADVEFIYPDDGDQPTDDDGDEDAVDLEDLFGGPVPEKILVHRGRIRQAALLSLPAFAEATIELVDDLDADAPSGMPRAPGEPMGLMMFGAIGTHTTATSTGSWDGPANEARLPSPMPPSKARAAYAWTDDAGTDDDGNYPKTACRFIHHEIDGDGNVGAANLTACSTGIGVIHGGRGGTTIPEDDRRGVYNHLASHQRDGGQEPVPFTTDPDSDALVAAAHQITIPDLPPAEWFDEPADLPPFGAVEITDAGRIYGLLAPANVPHRGRPDRAPAPLGRTDYDLFMRPRSPAPDFAAFHNPPVLVANPDGTVGRIRAGSLTLGCGHANPAAETAATLDHYDHSCSVVARVRVGENAHGVWVAGALLPDVTPAQVQRMLACQLSGDWRPLHDRPGRYELAAALFVPVPGYPRPAAPAVRVAGGALVASAVNVRHATDGPTAPDLRPLLHRLDRAAGHDPPSRLRRADRRVGYDSFDVATANGSVDLPANP